MTAFCRCCCSGMSSDSTLMPVSSVNSAAYFCNSSPRGPLMRLASIVVPAYFFHCTSARAGNPLKPSALAAIVPCNKERRLGPEWAMFSSPNSPLAALSRLTGVFDAAGLTPIHSTRHEQDKDATFVALSLACLGIDGLGVLDYGALPASQVITCSIENSATPATMYPSSGRAPGILIAAIASRRSRRYGAVSILV